MAEWVQEGPEMEMAQDMEPGGEFQCLSPKLFFPPTCAVGLAVW